MGEEKIQPTGTFTLNEVNTIITTYPTMEDATFERKYLQVQPTVVSKMFSESLLYTTQGFAAIYMKLKYTGRYQ